MDNVYIYESIMLEQLESGISRKILAHSENMMMVEVHFDNHAIGEEHTHKHEQIAYIKSGKFEFTIDGKKQIVSKGDSIYFEPNQLHGTICLESGIILDIFTPRRDDFIK